jgi:anti-sigma regulatory factor (Ser/Thr protein kinase)
LSSVESRLVIRGNIEQVPTAREFVAQAARRAGLSEQAVYHCQLATDELCTNIVEHGYRFQGDSQNIEIVCRVELPNFVITIVDEGPEFNPLNLPSPDPERPLEQRHGGGWGIHFSRQIMDYAEYSRQNNRNRTTLVKRITK